VHTGLIRFDPPGSGTGNLFPALVQFPQRIVFFYGSGRSIRALTTLKIAVAPPIPSASVTAATEVNPAFTETIYDIYDRSDVKTNFSL